MTRGRQFAKRSALASVLPAGSDQTACTQRTAAQPPGPWEQQNRNHARIDESGLTDILTGLGTRGKRRGDEGPRRYAVQRESRCP